MSTAVAVALVFGTGISGFWFEKAAELNTPKFVAEHTTNVFIAFVVTAWITIVNVDLRWLRWHFLIRRAGASLGTKDSVLIYTSTVPAIVTPFYLGELLRVFLLGKRYSRYRLDIVAIWALERCSDLLAMCLFLSLIRGKPTYVLAAAGVWVVVVVALKVVYGHIRRSDFPRPWTLLTLLFSSLALGTLPGIALWVIAKLIGMPLDVFGVFDVYASSTILGNVTGAPSGIGVTGSAMVLAFQKSGVGLVQAMIAAWLYRMGTVMLMIALGCLIVVAFRKRLLAIYRLGQTQENHFDHIAEQYDEEIPGWIRDRLLTRKIAAMQNRLSAHGLRVGSRGLDLGCGQGWHVCEMAALGYLMSGVDQSEQQLRFSAQRARERGLSVETRVASVSALPFPDGHFDFVYAINMFHHIPEEQRERAFAEVVRVLKPQGIFVLQEINTYNPLFRFYMGYLFPLLRGIDEGTEKWIRSDRLPGVPGARWLDECDYFTFLPDFLPAGLMRAFSGVERFLETSPLRRLSAHYVAQLVKTPPSEISQLLD